MKVIYLLGSLRNPIIPQIGRELRNAGFEVFDDWFAGGKRADDEWKSYEQTRGRSYATALSGYAAVHTFQFDYYHLNRADIGVLVYPAGKSAHMELGYMIGRGKPGYILLEEDSGRWDVMLQFASGIFYKTEPLIHKLQHMEAP